jgi:phenylalanyl-tRNA synthetase beta chain
LRSWQGGEASNDFFALKGALEALAGQLGTTLSFAAIDEPFLHPGRAASIGIDGVPSGWIGELHPLVCREWDIETAVAFEVPLAPLAATANTGEEIYEDVTTFPAVYQDLAVVLPREVPVEHARLFVLAAGRGLLRTVEVFDLYEGEQVGEGGKSVAMRLEFQAADRTLTDEEVGAQRAVIEATLEQIGGSLRG